MGMNVGQSNEDEDGGVMVDINTTPLIDVMLVLLIMFIITIPIQTHAVKMNMPIPSNNVPVKPPEIVRIDITEDGTIGWNGVPLNGRAELEAKFREIADMPDQSEVHMRPDKSVSYKHVAMVLATAQRLRVTKIGIVGNEQFL